MLRSVFAVGVFASMACFSVQAQSETLKASIPFEFRVGAAVLPAGEYSVVQSGVTLMLRTESGPAKAAVTLVRSAYRPAAQAPGKLVFNRYGNDYFLSKVWSPDTQMGVELSPGSLEKEIIARVTNVQTAGVRLQRK